MVVTESNQSRIGDGTETTRVNSTSSAPPVERTVGFRYGCAILSTLMMLLLRVSMNPWLGIRAPFGLFFISVVFTSWVAGFGPGLLATLLGILVGIEIAAPQLRFALSGVAEWVGVINFVLTSTVIVILNERQRRAKAEADLNILALHTKQDLLEQKQAEVEALNARLQRAMQETHHRVKNNLQVVMALTELHIEPGAPTVPATAIQRISSHLQGLATIHDLLTQTARESMDFSTLHARAILDKLIPLLRSALENRRILYTADDVMLSARQGTALAILINELVSNALKHGSGDIAISLNIHTTSARLEVCDEGTGFPVGFDPGTAANTGLELIDSVGRWDLRGAISYENQSGGGARVTVTFPVGPEAFAVTETG